MFTVVLLALDGFYPKFHLPVPLAAAKGVAVQRLNEAIVPEFLSIDTDDDLAFTRVDRFSFRSCPEVVTTMQHLSSSILSRIFSR